MRMLGNRTRSNERVQRNATSYYRTYQHESIGGREWVNILIATGDIDDTVVTIMNELVQDRLRVSCSTAEARQKKRSERELTSAQGIQHTQSEAKRWRAWAKSLDNKVNMENDLYTKGRSELRFAEWEKLTAERTGAWDMAEQLSEQAGNPYKDRKGDWHNTEPSDLTGIALRRWCSVKGYVYS